MKQNIMMILAALSAVEMNDEKNHYQSPFDVGIREVQKEPRDLQKDTQRLEAAEAKRERKRLKRLAALSQQKDLSS
jgi:hypothetical protein